MSDKESIDWDAQSLGEAPSGRVVPMDGYAGCDPVVIDELLARRREAVAYLADIQARTADAKAAGDETAIVALRSARQSAEGKIGNINRELKAERHRVVAERLRIEGEKVDLVRDLTLFQCLRKASAILSHRSGEDEAALRVVLTAYLEKNKKPE